MVCCCVMKHSCILGLWHHLWMCCTKKATEAWLLQRRSNHNKFKNPVMDAACMYLLLYHSTAASPAQRPVQRPTVSLVQWLEDLVNVLNLILSVPVSTTTHHVVYPSLSLYHANLWTVFCMTSVPHTRCGVLVYCLICSHGHVQYRTKRCCCAVTLPWPWMSMGCSVTVPCVVWVVWCVR
jgi:hypothetical protein